MRCNECNVDLGEEYTKCPLCGAEAVSDEPVLKGIQTAAYPVYDETPAAKKYKYDFPQKFVLRVSMAVCAVLGVAALFSRNELWSYAVPSIVALNALFYFVCGLFEKKGKLLHSLVALLATMAFSLLTVIISAVTACGFLFSARVLCLSAVLFALLCLTRRKRAGAQLRALFAL